MPKNKPMQGGKKPVCRKLLDLGQKGWGLMNWTPKLLLAGFLLLLSTQNQ